MIEDSSISNEQKQEKNETQTTVMECFQHLPAVPAQTDPSGVRFDFNAGLRIQLPDNGKAYHCLIVDMDENNVIHDAVMAPDNRFVSSLKKYYVKFHIEIREADSNKLVFKHTLRLKGKDVVIWMPVPAIGDTIAWFSYVERFRKKHNCNITCVMNPRMIDIFSRQYPEMKFTTPEKVTPDAATAPYATYYLGLFLQDDDFNFCPEDYRHAGLLKIAAAILNVDTKEIPPKVDLSAPPAISEPYVCISVMASSQPKFWNNPFGWNTVVKFLLEKGYRVICIDKLPVTGDGLIWNHIPRGAEDFTGELPLQQRIDLINHADFFIGLSSGLSWLAWCCKKDIVLISGFTHPCNEFQTPYRIINKHVCNSCWNDMRIEFDMADNLCCPRHKGTPEHFECTRHISPEKVIEAIKTIPIFRQRNIED